MWPNLLPCKKWKKFSKNLEVGDVCLLYFPGALAGQYKLVRVVEVHPDKKGLVRTVSIVYRKRDSREKRNVLKKKELVKEKVGVQRLVLIEAARESIEDDDKHGESNENDDNCGETFDEVPRVITYGQEVLLSTERVGPTPSSSRPGTRRTS